MEEVELLLQMKYADLVFYLQLKYGVPKGDYFTTTACNVPNAKIKKSYYGLFVHHIDEDKAILLSRPEHARRNPFAYQKADRLVYCNYLEHLLLHIKIVEEPRHKDANKNESPGIGGAMHYILPTLTKYFYDGYRSPLAWERNALSKIDKKDFDLALDYIKRMLYNRSKLNHKEIK